MLPWYAFPLTWCGEAYNTRLVGQLMKRLNHSPVYMLSLADKLYHTKLSPMLLWITLNYDNGITEPLLWWRHKDLKMPSVLQWLVSVCAPIWLHEAGWAGVCLCGLEASPSWPPKYWVIPASPETFGLLQLLMNAFPSFLRIQSFHELERTTTKKDKAYCRLLNHSIRVIHSYDQTHSECRQIVGYINIILCPEIYSLLCTFKVYSIQWQFLFLFLNAIFEHNT